MALIPQRADLTMILLLVGGMAGLMVLGAVNDAIRNRVSSLIGTNMSRDLRLLVFTKLQALSLGYIKDQKVGLASTYLDNTS